MVLEIFASQGRDGETRMSPIRITFSRTIGMARNYYATALGIGAFLASSAMYFAYLITMGEGGTLSAGSLWCVAVAPIVPILASFLSMDVWSDEFLTGRIDMLLASPVKESDLVLGKWLGVYFLTTAAAILSWISVWGTSLYFGNPIETPIAGIVAILMQTALWTAISVMMSARFRHAAAAATSSIVVMFAIPRGLWFAADMWLTPEQLPYSQMPLDEHVLNFSSGIISTGMVVGYIAFTALALLVTYKYVMMRRFAGYSGRVYRRSSTLVIVLSLGVAALLMTLAMRLDTTIELPLKDVREFSDRTRSVMANAQGDIEVSVLLSKHDSRFRAVAQLLKAFKREAESISALKLNLTFVDPRWDLGAAERIVRAGGKLDSVVFSRGRRQVTLGIEADFGERAVASSILQLVTPAQRRKIYWTTGHGEALPSEYGKFGMSDIARDLARDGFKNDVLSLEKNVELGSDTALIIVSGAKTDFSKIELAKLEAYLREGGRLLALIENPDVSGVNAILSTWGMNCRKVSSYVGTRTLTGSDVIVDTFSHHPITEPLEGTQVVLDRPVEIMPSAAVKSTSGADAIEFSPLVSAGGHVYAAVGERGAGAGLDLALRPTRVLVIGDALFAMNGQLLLRENANRDFFLNAVAYLSGGDRMTQSGADSMILSIPFGREERMISAFIIIIAVPFVVFALMVLLAVRRRHR